MLMIKDFSDPASEEIAVPMTAEQQTFASAQGHEFRFWNSTLLVRQRTLRDIDQELADLNLALDKASDERDAATCGELFLKRRKLQEEQKEQDQGFQVWEVRLQSGNFKYCLGVRFLFVQPLQGDMLTMHPGGIFPGASAAEAHAWLPLQSKLLTPQQNVQMMDLLLQDGFTRKNIMLDPGFEPLLDSRPLLYFVLVARNHDKTKTVALRVHLSRYISSSDVVLFEFPPIGQATRTVLSLGYTGVGSVAEFMRVAFDGLTWQQVRAGESLGLEGPLETELFSAVKCQQSLVPF